MSTMNEVFQGYAKRLAVLQQSNNPFARGVAWVENELVPLHEARIPLMDQGFQHSDLTYDVPAVWDGRFFRLDDHLDRLQKSCAKMRLRFPIPREQIKQTLVDMVAQSGIQDAFVEIIVTRGMQGVRECVVNKTSPSALKNNLYMFIQPYVWVMPPEMQLTGGDAIVARTVRRTPPGSHDPTIKNLQWGDLTRGLIEASDRGATYSFLTDGDANITEGSGFNIMFVKDRVIYTADRGVLEGITRKSAFDAARANGIEIRVEVVPVSLAYDCDECLMVTTAGGVMPITTLDGQPVKDGKLGPVTKAIWDEYWAMHWRDEFSFAIDYSVGQNGQVKKTPGAHVNGFVNGVDYKANGVVNSVSEVTVS
ncbi:aminotransferase [Neohortaea acidophila]|uniref:Aminotransferase n=1 Tax=Neohortaea acidophila TaxID=245834 RepID=A0A6A6PFW0_9PEZI|nr:aminotransferase [Neohortaea acidophila]KAF2478614.1 aminotransferase [Neohortaea acidophila]